MSEEVVFGTLADVGLREAWAHEAHHFTPWLAANLDRIAATVGIPLELTGTEVRVGTFSADILASNAADGSVVLIENQLESSDHAHLGQIMTYLAGLEAKTMIWIAPAFREEHLSAIRWLNEHTVDPFAFFAVRLRVVRIGDSPYAPLFEVAERPNNWDRQVASVKREAGAGISELGQFRLDFWTRYATLFPGGQKAGGTSSQWVSLAGTEAQLAQYVSQKSVGLFVRPAWGGDVVATREELAPFAEDLAHRLGVAMGEGRTMFADLLKIDMQNDSNWDRACQWLHDTTGRYQAVFAETLGVTD
jgi:hypothetical protein